MILSREFVDSLANALAHYIVARLAGYVFFALLALALMGLVGLVGLAIGVNGVY